MGKLTESITRLGVAGVLMLSTGASVAAGGLLGLDHRLAYDNSGIWKRSYQTGLLGLMVIGEIGGGLWEGGETRLGKTLWQSIDASVLAGGSALVLKETFTRERPNTTADPNKFFSGGSNQSFPSGEVAAVSAIVTPFIMEYGSDNKSVYLLETLPLYDAVARMKVRGHWQSDVLAGFVLGTGAGYLAHTRDSPFILNMLPNSVMVGYHKSW